jgi:glycerol-3-phosphate dehydrogenase
MARQVEDVLARRTRSLFLNAKASIECAPIVAQLMAQELNYDQDWIEEQIRGYGAIAQGYLLR